MADPRIYSQQLEEETGRKRAWDGYVVDRDHNYPQKYPLGIDHLNVDWRAPTTNLRSMDAFWEITETLRNGWSRLSTDAKQAWSFRQQDNYIPATQTLAAATGRLSTGVGVTGMGLHEDIDPSLGGGFIAVLHDATPPHQLQYAVQQTRPQ